jgi:hypothetical protein
VLPVPDVFSRDTQRTRDLHNELLEQEAAYRSQIAKLEGRCASLEAEVARRGSSSSTSGPHDAEAFAREREQLQQQLRRRQEELAAFKAKYESHTAQLKQIARMADASGKEILQVCALPAPCMRG